MCHHFDSFIGTSTLQKSAIIHRFFNYQIYTYVDKNFTFQAKIIETRLNPILQKRLQKQSFIETNYFGIIEPVRKVMLGKLQTFPLFMVLLVTETLNPNHYVINLYLIFIS